MDSRKTLVCVMAFYMGSASSREDAEELISFEVPDLPSCSDVSDSEEDEYDTQACNKVQPIDSEVKQDHAQADPLAEPLTLKRQFWHMTRLLRLVLNDRFDLLDERGMLEETLLRMTQNCAEIKANSTVKQTQLPQTGPKWHVAAAFGHLSGHRADWLVEKCTELGAQTLTPLLTQRSATDAEECNMERWRRIGRVASKQCQRSDELDVREPTRIKSLWTEVRKAKVAFFASAGAPPLGQTLIQRSETLSQGGLLLIGPEGDFTPVEISLLIRAGAVPVGLGQQRLRVETTTIAMLSTVILLAEGSAVDAKKG